VPLFAAGFSPLVKFFTRYAILVDALSTGEVV
jgi:hypothetical protein